MLQPVCKWKFLLFFFPLCDNDEDELWAQEVGLHGLEWMSVNPNTLRCVLFVVSSRALYKGWNTCWPARFHWEHKLSWAAHTKIYLVAAKQIDNVVLEERITFLSLEDSPSVGVTGLALWINRLIWVTQAVSPSLCVSPGPYQLLTDSLFNKKDCVFATLTVSVCVSATKQKESRAGSMPKQSFFLVD